MESLFSFADYRAFLVSAITSRPKQGYGVNGQLARAIDAHPSLVSQILAGTKQLTPDQALATARFFGLSELETDYFLLLVQLDRAGTPALRAHLLKQIAALKEKSRKVAARVDARAELTEETRGIFYSSWVFSAIRQSTAIESLDTPDAVAKALDLPLADVRRALDFLLKHGLCVENAGKLSIGPRSTHVPESSPWARMHHRNWRDQAARAMERSREEDLFFTSPMTMGSADVPRVRELILKFIEEMNKIVDPSPSEELRCLNLDWFGPRKAD